MNSENYRDVVQANIFDQQTFIKATFTGRQRIGDVQWIKVEIRPVSIKGDYRLQFVHYDTAQAITKNYTSEEAKQKLDEVIDDDFRNIYIQSQASSLQIQITKKGKALIRRHTNVEQQAPDLSHDREKARLVSSKSDDPYLKAIGIMNPNGAIKPDMQAKYRQVNEFLRIVETTGHFSQQPPESLEVIDCGAGNAYLTFGIYHYFGNILKIPTHVTGIDVDAGLVERNNQIAHELGWDNIKFEVSNIQSYSPPTNPDIVLALHACDTATDEALAQAIKWGAKWVFSVPCCHHDIQQQLMDAQVPYPFEETLQHGILRERLGDIITDTFRSSILKMMGYDVDVIQFVSSSHTAKNIMIRAVKGSDQADDSTVEQYAEQKRFWHVTPYLESLLQNELSDPFTSSK
jgi:SAM-dependent methyltransferase